MNRKHLWLVLPALALASLYTIASGMNIVSSDSIICFGTNSVPTRSTNEFVFGSANDLVTIPGGVSIAQTNFVKEVVVTNGVTASSLSVGTVTYTNPPAPPSFLVGALPAAATGTTAWASDMITPWGTGDFVYYDGSYWKGMSTKIRAKSVVADYMLELARVGWEGRTPIQWGIMADNMMNTTTLRDHFSFFSGSGTGAGLGFSSFSSPEDPCGISVQTGTDNNGYYGGVGGAYYNVAGSYLLTSFRIALNAICDGTDNYYAELGAGGFSTTGIDASAIIFYYDPGDTLALGVATNGNWKCLTRASSANTVVDSGIAASTSWTTFTILHTSTNAVFWINSTAVATNTAHIPTGSMNCPRFNITKTLGTNNRYFSLDWVYLAYRFAAARTFF